MTIRPSETAHGAAWVNNFPPEEQSIATLLINSIRVLSDATFRANLTELLSRASRNLPYPAAIYPVHEINSGSSGTESDFPFTSSSGALPGSEGAVGHIIRDVIGHRPDESRATSLKSLESLRRIKVRTLIFVDDYSSTGNRVAEYLNFWTSHPTIRSWLSYRLIKIHIVLHAVSAHALRALEKNPRVEGIHFFEHAPDFSTARWSREETAAIRRLCVKHSTLKNFSLGYKNAEGLWAMQHTVPNNLPMILWQDKHKSIGTWHPFFGGRVMSPDLQLELGDYKLETRATDIATSLRQPRLANALADQPGSMTRLLFLTLGAAARGIRDVRRLSIVLGTPLASAEATQQAARQLGLLDRNGRLTTEGHRELKRARVRATPATPDRRLISVEEPYYPWQLRGVGDI